MFALITVAWVPLLLSVGGKANLLTNGDFELPIGGTDNWFTTRCTATQYTDDVVSGNYSLRVSDITKPWGSVRYDTTIILEPNKRYFVSGWVKVISSEAGVTSMRLVQLYKLDKGDEGAVQQSQTLDKMIYEVGVDGWVKLSAEFVREDFSDPVLQSSIYLNAQQTEPYPEYLLDDFLLEEMVSDPAWKTKAVARYEEERKTNVTIRLNVSKNQKDYYSRMRLTFKQVEGYFGIGANVDSFLLNTNEKYKETFNENFEWATLNTDLSWRRTEYSQFELTWEDSDAGMKQLQDMRKKVRGGSIHESAQSLQPDFVKRLMLEDDIYRSSMKRVDDLVGRYRYQCNHWDVINRKFSDGNFLSARYGSDSLDYDLYRRTKAVDFAAHLFINDGGLIDTGENIAALRRLIGRMRAQGVPISGIGAEANFGENFPAPHLINHRLAQLSELGLPIWLTGFSYSHDDPAERSAVLEDFIVIALGHPSVEGIMLNEFWDGDKYAANASLFEGSEHLANDAGRVFQNKSEELNNWSRVDEISVVPSEIREMTSQLLYPGQYSLLVEYYKDSEWKRLKSYDNLNVRKDKENEEGTMIFNAYF